MIIIVFAVSAAAGGEFNRYLPHIAVHSVYVLFLTWCFFAGRIHGEAFEARFNGYLNAVFFVSLMWTTAVSLLNRNITSYIMALLIFAIVFTVKPRAFIIIQLILLLPLIALLHFITDADFVLLYNYIYIIFGSFLSILMCTITYNSVHENFVNKKAIEIQNEELKELSETDALTTLLNRRKFNEVVVREWRRSIRNSTDFTLIMVDIDFFKIYNDTYGHLKGDECLRLIGMTLKEKFQRATEYVARYGGEEFMIIMANTDRENGVRACRWLTESIERLGIPNEKSAISDIVTVSAGMSVITPTAKDNLEQHISNADAALYRAKAGGRNRFVVFEESAEDIAFSYSMYND
jgi:diguanylate cyclase (GGDEF)-like protein